jgi:hypothetical protein
VNLKLDWQPTYSYSWKSYDSLLGKVVPTQATKVRRNRSSHS